MIRLTLFREDYRESVTVKPEGVLPVVERLKGLGVKSCDIVVDNSGVTFVVATDNVNWIRVFVDDEGLSLTSSDDIDPMLLNQLTPLLMPLLVGAVVSASRKLRVINTFEKVGDDYDN